MSYWDPVNMERWVILLVMLLGVQTALSDLKMRTRGTQRQYTLETSNTFPTQSPTSTKRWLTTTRKGTPITSTGTVKTWSTSSEIPGRGCPTPPPDEPWRYMYPFPGDCTKFYTCSNGQAVVEDCPQGTWFNNKLEICDWPQHSGCVQPSPGTSSEAPITTNGTTETSNGTSTVTSITPGPTSTSEAPMTSTGTAKTWSSPTAITSTTPGTPPTSSATPGRGCPTPPPDEPWRYMYPFPGDCTKFYTCSNGQAVVEDCPQGTWFNNELEICDWPQHSGCVQPSPGTSSEAPITTNGTTQTSNGTSTVTSITPGPTSTSEAPMTSTGTAKTWSSPTAITSTTPGTPPTSSATPGRGCPTPPPDEPWRYMYPFPGDCTKFYTCSNGQAVVEDCPQGTWFNNKLEICDWPQHSGCVQPSPGTSSEAPITTNGTTETSNGTSTDTSISPGPTSTSEAPMTSSDTPETWASPTAITPTTPDTLSTSSETPGRECPTPPPDEPWRYMYPFPGDCTKFYTCSNGQAVVEDCPQGTWFNNKLEICDWPQHSGCVQPTPETLEM